MSNTFGQGADPLQAAIDSMGAEAPSLNTPTDLGAPPMESPPIDPVTSPVMPVPELTPAPEQIPEPPAPPPAPVPPPPAPTPAPNGAMVELRRQALGELKPMLKGLDLPVEKKFGMYKEIVEGGDDTVLTDAYEIAKGISEPKEKADALLYIIDKTG